MAVLEKKKRIGIIEYAINLDVLELYCICTLQLITPDMSITRATRHSRARSFSLHKRKCLLTYVCGVEQSSRWGTVRVVLHMQLESSFESRLISLSMAVKSLKRQLHFWNRRFFPPIFTEMLRFGKLKIFLSTELRSTSLFWFASQIARASQQMISCVCTFGKLFIGGLCSMCSDGRWDQLK